CADAAASHSYVGCDYWPTVLSNHVWSVFDFAVVVSNAGSSVARITVDGPGQVHIETTVAPSQLTKIYLPWIPDLKGADMDECTAIGVNGITLTQSIVHPQGAYHLVSTTPVTVYQFSPLEYKGEGGPPGKDWSSCPGLRTCGFDPPISHGCFSFTNDASLL